jgi:hypothetical protein
VTIPFEFVVAGKTGGENLSMFSNFSGFLALLYSTSSAKELRKTIGTIDR